MKEHYAADIQEILSHRQDNGDDLWTTKDKKLLKGAPFTTLESISYLLELGVTQDNPIMKQAADLIFSVWKKDGRFKTSPTGGIYPCHSALATQTLCSMGYQKDPRIQISLQYFLDTQQADGGWKCNKYSFGRGPETAYSTPNTTLTVLDALRYTEFLNQGSQIDQAVEFLLAHWVIRKPISPCQYGIGSRFMEIEYPFRGYNLFRYVYILSFYHYAKQDSRFQEAFQLLTSKLVDNQVIVERVVPKLANLSFCQKGKPSALATQRYQEILNNLTRK